MTSSTVIASATVIVLDSRLGAVLPAAALPVLRKAEHVYKTEGVSAEFDADPAPDPEKLPAEPVVLITDDPTEPAAAALIESGAQVMWPAAPDGVQLLAGAAVMDRLRGPGGCPWDAEQTHESLRQYLTEETYELLEAIEDGDRGALREELGDVLLQVLFHARIAAEHAEEPFTIDDVAADLVTKLVSRHPHVFDGGDPAVSDAASQELRWEELKQVEKRRESSVDGVALGQPAVALAAKLVSRASRAGLPSDLLPGAPVPAADGTGEALFALAASAKLAGAEPEGELRAVARRFAADVRATETAARAAGIDPAGMAEANWRAHWPHH